MNEEQRIGIYRLRKEGLGYRAIANRLNMNVESVSKYCKANYLFGSAEVVKLNIVVLKEKNMICKNCEKFIKQSNRGRKKKFCSDYCRKKYWEKNNENKKKYFFTCLYCSTGFKTYGNRDRTYCSRKCYIKSRFGEDKG